MWVFELGFKVLPSHSTMFIELKDLRGEIVLCQWTQKYLLAQPKSAAFHQFADFLSMKSFKRLFTQPNIVCSILWYYVGICYIPLYQIWDIVGSQAEIIHGSYLIGATYWVSLGSEIFYYGLRLDWRMPYGSAAVCQIISPVPCFWIVSG